MILSEVRGIQTKSTDPAFVDRPSDLERNSLSQLCRRQPLRPLRLFLWSLRLTATRDAVGSTTRVARTGPTHRVLCSTPSLCVTPPADTLSPATSPRHPAE